MTKQACDLEKYAVSVRDLKKSFGNTHAVRGVSFGVREGEIFSLLGINGAGKTTTIRMLTGLLRPDSGEARLFGEAAGSQAAGRILGLSPQETASAGNLTAEENFMLMARLYGIGNAREHTEEMLDVLGLTEHRHKRSKNLSGGLRRRLSIGMALIAQPRVLFLDEPTLGLDVLARRELHALIVSLKQTKKMTVFLTTHDMEEAELLSDRIAVMMNGQLRAVGTLEELRQIVQAPYDARLEDVFVKFAEGGEGL